MIRSTLFAGALLAAAVGLTGCTTTDAHFATGVALSEPVGIVSVPQSDWCQWYYRWQAMRFIRETNPDFKDGNILKEGVVAAGDRIDQPKVGPDGKPLPKLGNTEMEYQIAFRHTPLPSQVIYGPTMQGRMGNGMPTNTNGMPMTTTGMPASGMPTNTMGMPSTGMPMNTVTPAGGMQPIVPNTGVQNVSPQYPPANPPPMPGYQSSMPGSAPMYGVH